MVPFDIPATPERQYPGQVDSRYDPAQGPCLPDRLQALPPGPAADDQRAGCRREAENHRVSQEALEQSFRATNAAEEALKFSFFQTRIAFIQAILSTLAAVFTGWAAWEASRAAMAAQDSVEDARSDAAEQSRRFADQLRLATHAADAATKSADAMKSVAESMALNTSLVLESVTVSRDVADAQRLFGRTQLRAYLAVLIGAALYQDRSANLRFEARPVILNTGHTPARNLRWRVAADVLPVPLPTDFRFPIPAHRAGSALLAPQQNANMTAVVGHYVGDADVSVVKAAHGKALYVWGYLVYEDIFRRTHRTTFAQQLAWEPVDGIDQNWRAPEKIVGLYLAKHNKAN